jgi:hypothetical protein
MLLSGVAAIASAMVVYTVNTVCPVHVAVGTPLRAVGQVVRVVATPAKT